LNFLNLKALVTTVTEDIPIAAAANIGLRSIPKKGKSIPAATGIKIVLHANAQKRSCLMFLRIALERAI
jgi:hypothetical protein